MLFFVGFLVVVGALSALALWAQARRRRGEEASTSRAEGAEGLWHWPGAP